jgi:hypothetical protein
VPGSPEDLNDPHQHAKAAEPGGAGTPSGPAPPWSSIMHDPLNDNPDRSPESAGDDSLLTDSTRDGIFEQMGRVIVTWEKLRLLYNAIGFAPTFLIAVSSRVSFGELAGCVVLANVCFCMGPVADCYLTWFGFRRKVVTIALFVLITGTMLFFAANFAIYSAFPHIGL